jgi:predicted secreted protein
MDSRRHDSDAASPPDPSLGPTVDEYRPVSPKQRRVIILITLVTVFLFWTLLLTHPGGDYSLPDIPRRDVAPCQGEQTQGCVGGQANVTLLPATAPASSINLPPAMLPGAASLKAEAVHAPASAASAAAKPARHASASGR